jgi:hypothetical protein
LDSRGRARLTTTSGLAIAGRRTKRVGIACPNANGDVSKPRSAPTH